MKGYDTYECPPCEGSGASHDPTNADKVNVHPSAGKCPRCSGRGFLAVVAGWNPRPGYHGNLIALAD